MKQSNAVLLVVWVALGTAAFFFLKWRNADIDAESSQLMPLILDSLPVALRRDSLPKPFSRLKAPLVVIAPRPGAVAKLSARLRALPGEAVAVSITAYCLRGTTRSGTPVRNGIVAADPRVFPLLSEIEVQLGDSTLGIFRVEDTGLLIKGRIIDLWLADCGEARRFGRKRGVATLIPKTGR